MMPTLSSAPAIASWPIQERRLWVRSFRRLIATRARDLAQLMQAEVGKPLHEGLMGDVGPLLAVCKWLENSGEAELKPRRQRGGGVLTLGQKVWVQRVPLGHIAIIATWNYPVHLLGVQLVQALFAGNRVTVKPSEHAPRTQELLLCIAREAGCPQSVLSWTAATREAGRTLLETRQFDHVIFTGSTPVGQAIARTLAATLTPSTLECSGRDSALVLADADPVLAAKSIWNGVEFNGGQTCMGPRRALVHAAVYDRFLAALSPLAAGVRPRRLIDSHAANHTFDLAYKAAQHGGRSLSGILEPPQENSLVPLAIVDCPANAELVKGDHFGPAIAVICCESLDHMLAIHRAAGQYLATSIFTADVAAAQALAPSLGSGTVTINDCIMPTAGPLVGIGASGLAGWGVTQGREGLLALTKPLYITSTSRILRPPLGEPLPKITEQLFRFIQRWYGR
ncbi:MAG: aldehyde dehydrogenase [Planctomycetes bacterium]|nr:aldehyde dehydrogenase [Planctomycetota bacterium]